MDTTAPKRSRIQIANRASIVEAALAVFSSEGYRGATIDAIAAQAGMSKPNLLYYFKTKEDIYREVLESTVEGWLEPFSAIDADGDPVEELKRYIILKIRMSRDHPEASRLFANEIGRGAPISGHFLNTRLRELVTEKASVIQSWMDADKLRPVDPFHLIFVIWATTQHYADFEVQVRALVGEKAEDDGFYEDAATAVLSIILGGIEPKEGS